MTDIILERRIGLREFATRLKPQLPAGLRLASLSEVPLTLPPLASQVVAAEYEVLVKSEDSRDVLQARLEALLAAESISRRRERPRGQRVYDLRPLIQRLWLVGRRASQYVIGMRLQADERGTGRPDEVMAALAMADTVRATERVRLIFPLA
jgi:radical SAM-linked protein